jgi:DNA repair exonuclease SbcCD nuclease subunit
MKHILIGDLHLGIKGGSRRYLEIAEDLINFVISYAKEHDINHLIQVGDTFDNRRALTHDTIDTALEIARRVNEFFSESYFIVGNHDTANKDSMFPHALQIFEEFENIKVVDEPLKVNNILMLPWIFYPETDMIDADICIGHFDINGVMMNSAGTLSRNHRLNLSDFSKYKLTISGHYHTPNVYNHNVHYIGTPYQLNFNDIGSDRGFWVVDDKTFDMTLVRFDNYPHHFSYTDKSNDIDNIEGHIVRLVFTEDHGIEGNKDIIEKFRSMNPYSLRVKYARVDEGMTNDSITEEISVKNKENILLDFYNKSTLPDGINMVLLNKITKSLYKELRDE